MSYENLKQIIAEVSADVNAQDAQGNTALLWDVSHNNAEMAKAINIMQDLNFELYKADPEKFLSIYESAEDKKTLLMHFGYSLNTSFQTSQDIFALIALANKINSPQNLIHITVHEYSFFIQTFGIPDPETIRILGAYSHSIILTSSGTISFSWLNKEDRTKLQNQEFGIDCLKQYPDKLAYIRSRVEEVDVKEYIISDSKEYIFKDDDTDYDLGKKNTYYNKGHIKIFKHDESAKKSVIIHGHDDNGAFENTKLDAYNMFRSGDDVLVIDARIQAMSVEDIIMFIITHGFKDFDNIIINMHGGPAQIISDTTLALNKPFSFIGPNIIFANDFFKALTKFNDKPIKLILNSCYGQLITHKIGEILPSGSEIITSSEYQLVEGILYSHNGFDYGGGMFFSDNQDLKEAAAKARYYSISPVIPSETYSKIGECNFRTSINLSKKDITELLAKVSITEVSDAVAKYLAENEGHEKGISEKTENLIHLFEVSNEQQPLLHLRGNNYVDITKYQGIASAIYALYGQCGQKMITDSDFTPNQDNFIAENILVPVLLTLPYFMQDSITKIVGFIIDEIIE